MTENIRDVLGRVVRETWVNYCIQTGRTAVGRLGQPWEQMDEWDREMDRRIAEAVIEFERKRLNGECLDMLNDEVLG